MIGLHNGNTFRNEVNTELAARSGALTEIKYLSMSPIQGAAQSVAFDWSSQGMLAESLSVEGLVFNQSPLDFFTGWSGIQVKSRRGKLKLNSQISKAQFFGQSSPGYESEFEAESLSSDGMDLFLDGFMLVDDAMAYWRWAGYSTRFFCNGGSLIGAVLPGYALEQFMIEKQDGVEHLSALVRKDGSRSEISIEGALFDEAGDLNSWATHAQDLPSSDLFDERLEAWVKVSIHQAEGSFTLLSAREDAAGKRIPLARRIDLDLELKAHRVELAAFDCLDTLASLLRKNSYRRPLFIEPPSMQFSRVGPVQSLSDIRLSTVEGLQVRGALQVGQQGLSGELELGIPTRYMREVEEHFIASAFTKKSGEHLWQTVKVWTEKGEVRDDLEHYLISEQNRLSGYVTPEVESDEAEEAERVMDAPQSQEDMERAFDELISN
ncbi:hypothetical protein [Rubritalea marina]|uniref:hypothetical protein n=1 Tax=Rubritalea marina TaxID=361055 RepID=UPI00036ED39A|nr:hypothetical protein [Rubritalea marina]